MARADVIVVGEIYIDHVFSGFECWPEPGEEVHADRYQREAGGGAVTTACALGRLGRNVELFGVVGQEDKEWLANRLASFAVRLPRVVVMQGSSGVTLSVSTPGDRSFFTYRGVNGRIDECLLAPQVADALACARHVHFAMPLEPRLASGLLPALREAGCTISLDVGFQPAWLHDARSLDVCAAVDFFMPNGKEARLLCGEESAEGYLKFALRHRFPHAPLKDGPRGGYEMECGGLVHVIPPVVDVLDTTGAGDAFDAGYIDAWLDRLGTRARLQRACICGALSTRTAGALASLPDRRKLDSVQKMTYET